MEPKSDGKLFKNKILESLTRTHIAVPLTIFYGAAAVLIGYSLYYGVLAPLSNLWMFVVGFLLFTFIEYLVHRYVFHIATDTPKKERFQYTFHGVHHDFPRDKSRLAMPPVMSVVLALAFFFFYKLILGNYGLPFTAGFLAGYATYLCVHYSVHAFRPPKNFMKILWVHHAIHHYQDPDRAFGVSSPLWDVIFGTMPRKRGSFKMNKDAPV